MTEKLSKVRQKYIADKLKPLMPIFAKASIGNFSADVRLPKNDNEFTDLYTGIQIMIDVIRDKIQSLETAKARDEAILTHIGEGLIVSDSDGKIIIMNPAAEKLLGYKVQDVLGKKLVKTVEMTDERGSNVTPELRPMTLALGEGKKTSGNFNYKRTDNTFFPVRITVTPLVLKNSIVGSVEVFRDISREKEIMRMKDEFISIVSHELKTPLTSIKVFTQVLQNKLVKAGDMNTALLFTKMEAQLNKLSALISDLLDITRIETGKLQFEMAYFDFNELAVEIIEEILRTTNNHRVINKLAKSKTILANRDRVGQVLTNLLSNAIKYSPNSEKIIISSVIRESELIVSIRDFGVGIPKRMQKHLFERYFRVEDKKRSTFPGMGLGLYISAEIIKRHKGKIWAESEEGAGSIFYFSLPLTS